jgi:hypothetical protein
MDLKLLRINPTLKSEIIDLGQRWLHRLVDRAEEVVGSAGQAGSAAGRKQWPAPAFFLRISIQAQALFSALNRSTVAVIDSGKSKLSALYDGSGMSFSAGDDRGNSKAWAGENSPVAGKWRSKAFNVTLSDVGHLAGGIVENYSGMPEDSHPFVRQVVRGRSVGRYDERVFGEVRKLFKRDGVQPLG